MGTWRHRNHAGHEASQVRRNIISTQKHESCQTTCNCIRAQDVAEVSVVV